MESENSGPGKGDQGEEDIVSNRKVMMVLKYLCPRERQNEETYHVPPGLAGVEAARGRGPVVPASFEPPENKC